MHVNVIIRNQYSLRHVKTHDYVRHWKMLSDLVSTHDRMLVCDVM